MAKVFKEEITKKEQVLGDVRNAIIEKLEDQFQDIDRRTDTWVPIKEEDGSAITFVQNLKSSGGIFIYLESDADMIDCIRQLAPENGWEPLWCTEPVMQDVLRRYGIPFTTEPERQPKQKLVGITSCECLVAQTGSVVLTDSLCQTRLAYALPDILLVCAKTSQIVNGLKEAFHRIEKKYGDDKPSQIAIITGPSRTSDIEQTQVVGVSGVRQLAVLLIDEE